MAESLVLKNHRKLMKQYTTMAIKHRHPTVAIPDCREYYIEHNKQQKELDIICLLREDLLNTSMEWAYDLAERNLKQKYVAYGLCWHKRSTYNNLCMYWARYLIAYDPVTYIPVGYVMFRFDFILDHTIVQIYDIHVEEVYKNKGIGTHLMITLEVLARRFGMQLLLVSVARKDFALTRFFHRLGYTADFTENDKNPEYVVLIAPTQCYKIMKEAS